MRQISFCLVLFLSLVGLTAGAQDTVRVPVHDTVRITMRDTMVVVRHDTVTLRVVDSVAIKMLQDKLQLAEEKDQFYKSILTNSGVDKNKIESDRDHYRHLVDSLRSQVRECELDNVRKEEANKYLAQRAKDAEGKVAEATNRKKKVRAIQGIAMRFYRTPSWEIQVQPNIETGIPEKVLCNRNAGNIEFDFVTGASVMLWDLTKFFNKDHESKQIGETNIKTPELRKFDQDFAYDIGIYVGFGGSNLFKNFYVGPSFRF
ncbi:MAG: hypothetical protein J5641_03275, partial [Bacteroidales bacterium]|nr:hypothetical protein [Bacteroidales bacterium]